MNEIGEKFLPIGTVVILKGGKKRIMITGYCPTGKGKKEGKVFDYSGCIYPEGMMFTDTIAIFDHSQIDKVYHTGLIDDEFKEFNVKVTQLYNAMTLISPVSPDDVLTSNSEVKPENTSE